MDITTIDDDGKLNLTKAHSDALNEIVKFTMLERGLSYASARKYAINDICDYVAKTYVKNKKSQRDPYQRYKEIVARERHDR